MVAAWVIFPEFHPPQDAAFTKAYLPPSSVPPSPPPSKPQPAVEVSTGAPSTPTRPIIAPTDTHTFKLPVPVITPATPLLGVPHDTSPNVVVKPNTISPKRLKEIKKFVENSRLDDPRSSDGDPRRIKAKFPVYLASYADGDWGCNVHMKDGKIVGGSLPDLIAKVSEWSHGHITAEVMPTPLNIGGPDLLDKKPPFIFFTGHKDFVLTPQEVRNLQDYVEMGGLIWGDNALAGRGSRFDVAFRREMKRVVPDLDKNFEPVQMDDPIFTKSWYAIAKLPAGMNYYAEPMEHLDIDGKIAILYTPNDYSDMLSMRILPGDTQIAPTNWSRAYTSPLLTSELFLRNSGIFFRNYTLPSCLACDQFGMNVIGYLLVRFDEDLLLAP